MRVEKLVEKIQSLPPEKIAEVEDFVEFLKVRDEQRQLRLGMTKLSEASFARVWDNEADSVYDNL